jgi:diguanylate cyclase (GGDEF)-like protein
MKVRDEAEELSHQVAERPDRWSQLGALGAGDVVDRAASGPAAERGSAAEKRDRVAEKRDRVAEKRDRAAEERDRAAERDEAVTGAECASSDVGLAGAPHGEVGPGNRRPFRAGPGPVGEGTAASRDRVASLGDRTSSAGERAQSALDRDASGHDRAASAQEIHDASLDSLTGAYVRGAGLAELERDVSRTKRTGQPLTLVFVDVDQLKQVNDGEGHAAGDRLLVDVAGALRARLRPYDLIIRYGGDEFVCAVSDMTMIDTAARIALVNESLADRPGHRSVSVGLAQLEARDSVDTLVARADRALYQERSRRRAAL